MNAVPFMRIAECKLNMILSQSELSGLEITQITELS